MKRKREDAAADGEITAAVSRAGTSSSSFGGAAICDDVVRNIFARLPARDAVASMALSWHHRRLITSPDFVRLHCRHGAPLPRPHIAYVATAPVVTHRDMLARINSLQERGRQRERTMASTSPAPPIVGTNPMRALAGKKYSDQKYVGTCNGVILLAGRGEDDEHFSGLLNPAVADGEREVSVVVPPSPDDYHASGFGYGPMTRTYKLLLCKHKCVANFTTYSNGRRRRNVPVYSLGGGEAKKPRTVLAGLDGDMIHRRSLYMDGTVYLLNADKETVLAFDVDDETITSIALPGERVAKGRQCCDQKFIAVWLLTTERRWKRRCAFRNDWCWPATVAGVWDCGGALLIVIQADDESSIFMYDDATGEVSRLNPPPDASPEKSDYRIRWGYKPTVVTPASIVGEFDQEKQRCRDIAADVLAAVTPLNEMHKRKGQEAALHTVCFMEFLVGVMRKLPGNLRRVIAGLDQFY
ncbi:hypothetical protein DAI22_08g195500 [Oryza sativa Japonica Group]|nr:hypothetical protein DAI22_08g195500 [Oryza sativa Japonica Group]